MKKLFRFGTPFESGAVINKIEVEPKDNLSYFNVEKAERGFHIFCELDGSEYIYGLGVVTGALNKFGREYITFATDNAEHTPHQKNLYSSHPFLIIDGTECFGLFLDYPGKGHFDLGFSREELLSIKIENKGFDLYILEGESKDEIIREYISLVGKSYAPPFWAFGYQQSRWSYPNKETILEITNTFVEEAIPCDSIFLDLDYMDDFKVFTTSEERFKDFKNFTKELKERGFNLVPIIDPGVKVLKGYDVYEEGVKNNYFCKDKKGQDFIVAVWPGYTHLPDFLNSKTREWWGSLYKRLVDLGIEGFWNDMNEPAIFYTVESLNKAFKAVEGAVKKGNLGIYDFFALKDSFLNIQNQESDYKSFYHKLDDGTLVNHFDVHNLFAFNMNKATFEGLKKVNKNKRYLLFSRASYLGQHRYGGVWTGDNHSWYEHILLNLRQLFSLNMTGFLYSGADIGGFNADANSELLIRWTALGVFTPLFRNHSSLPTRRQEPFSFSEETTNILRSFINFRYALLPYIYSEFMLSRERSRGFIRPLNFEFENDLRARDVEDQALVGSSLMIAPIYVENAKGRYVYVPEKMLLWKMRKWNEREDMEVLERGDYYIEQGLSEILVFIRENKLIALTNPALNTKKMLRESLDLVGFVSERAKFELYEDDGETFDFERGIYNKLSLEINLKNSKYHVRIKNNTSYKYINLFLYDLMGERVHNEQILILD